MSFELMQMDSPKTILDVRAAYDLSAMPRFIGMDPVVDVGFFTEGILQAAAHIVLTPEQATDLRDQLIAILGPPSAEVEE